jgi:hypothetical protein
MHSNAYPSLMPDPFPFPSLVMIFPELLLLLLLLLLLPSWSSLPSKRERDVVCRIAIPGYPAVDLWDGMRTVAVGGKGEGCGEFVAHLHQHVLGEV